MPENRRDKPPRSLEQHTKPSRRHRAGVPRCQRWEIRDGEIWQCPKACRPDFTVCGVHGAGYPKRERADDRINPRLGSLTTGEKASPATVHTLFAKHPALGAMYDFQIKEDAALLDLRPQLALAKVLAMHFVQKVTSTTWRPVPARSRPLWSLWKRSRGYSRLPSASGR